MSTFTMQPQELDQWCWAAVAVSLSNYIKPNSAPSQCDLARTVLKVTASCCGDPPPEQCDQPAPLIEALDSLNRHSGEPIPGPLSFAQIRHTIDGGWPIPVRIVWDDNPANGHFVVISGYTPTGAPRLQVDDPFYGRSIVDYATFVSAYHGSGRWQLTYKVV